MTCDIKVLSNMGQVSIGTVSLCDHFSFAEGSWAWSSCPTEARSCQIYYFDLGAVTGMDASGLEWLKTFVQWARQAGRSVRLVNATPALREILAIAGIGTDGTAVRTEDDDSPHTFTHAPLHVLATALSGGDTRREMRGS